MPAGLLEPGQEDQFCCAGCRLVHETIHSAGLDRYYALRRAVERTDERAPARATGEAYAAMDDPAFAAEWVRTDDAGGAQVELLLEGVHCAACAWLVERLPRVVPGVTDARLDLPRRVARIRWRPDRVALSSVARALDRLGYPPHAHRAGASEALRRREDRRFLVRLGVAGACAGNAMLVAFALYGGMVDGMDATTATVLRGAGLAITAIAVLWPGRVFLAGAMSSLRTRVLHMDVPVALALVAGLAWGAVNTVRGAGEVYFESITAVIFLLLCGRWLQFRQQRRAEEAVEALYHLAPETARRLEADGTEREVPVIALEPGDRVVLRAGEAAPADGTIEAAGGRLGQKSGQKSGQESAPESGVPWDLALLTGESDPRVLEPGATVHAGAVALGGPVTLLVEATGAATRVGRLMGTVAELARERTPMVALADRVAHWFVLVVVVLAVVTAALWWSTDRVHAVEHAIALLIATCPCALGLATPLAISAAVGRAARAGILVKGGAALERLARPGSRATIVLDKTGTLTAGTMTVAAWHGAERWRAHAAALERDVPHPIARALASAGDSGPSGIPAAAVEDIVIEPGGGVRGRVDGHALALGRRDFVGATAGGWWDDAEQQCLAAGLTPVFVHADGAVVAVAGLGDPVLEDAAGAVADLRSAGWSVRMLSGDHPRVVERVAAAIGIEQAEGGATPERKVEVVRALAADGGTVVMVGDGLNDAAAFAAADIGVAVHGTAEASLGAADVALRRQGVQPLVALLLGAQRTLGAIRLGLIVSLSYNAAVAALAMSGRIDPIVAAIAMPLSSLTVVTLAWRARTFEPARAAEAPRA